MLWWLALVLFYVLAPPGLATATRIERTSPAVRQAPPGRVVTHVFAVYGQGRATPSFTSEHSWPILSSARPLNLDPQKATYLTVSIRIPPGTPEGSRDRLMVQVGNAQAAAYSQAAFQPSFQASWPRKVAYLPPLSSFSLRLRNAGNGPDTYLIHLENIAREPVFNIQISLAAGATKEVQIPVAASGSYRLVITSLRGHEKKEGFVDVALSIGQTNGAPRLLGRFGVAYSYPGLISTSAGLSGPLSDFAHFSFGIGYAVGSWPAGNAGISFDDGYFSIFFGRSYGLALGFNWGQLAAALSLTGPEWQGSLNLDAGTEQISYGLSAILKRENDRILNPQLGAYLQTGPLLPVFAADALRAEIAYIPRSGRVLADLSYDFDYRSWPLHLRYRADWYRNRPLNNTFFINAKPRLASFSGRISWSGSVVNDWGVAFASNDRRLQISSPFPFFLGASASPNQLRAFAGATIRLPYPGGDLSGRAEYQLSADSWSFVFSGSSRAFSFAGLAVWDIGGRLGWPLSENQFSLGVRAGGSYLRGHIRLDWAPWKPSIDTRLDLEMPVEGAVLRASLGREWYSVETRFGLAADLPWLLEVPQEVSEFFGGRRIGTVVGVVEVAGPARFRQGIVIRAGGETTVTDSEGRFELQLAPGEYEVEIDRARLPAPLVAVKASEKISLHYKETISVRLRVAVRSLLEGRVRVAGASLQPPPRFALLVEDERGRQTSLYTNSNGGFRLEGLPPGRYKVRLLTDLLPRGWRAVKPAAEVFLKAGAAGGVELVVAAPERKVYQGMLQILGVEPETKTAPAGAAPLVTVRIKGQAEQVLIESRGRVGGALFLDSKTGAWRGRVRLPADYEGPLQLWVVARAGDQQARYPFLIAVSKKAPWGLVRTLPVAKPGQELPVMVHLFSPATKCWIELAGQRIELAGSDADWQGKVTIPPSTPPGRAPIKAVALLTDGRQVEVVGWVLLRSE